LIARRQPTHAPAIVAGAVVLAIAAAAIAGCGGGSDQPVAIEVGSSAIAKPTVAHWMAVMAPEHVVPDPPRYSACIARQAALSPQSIASVVKQECAQQYQALRERALGFLISSRWLLDEAADRGVAIPAAQVRQRLQAQSGERPAGESAADAKLAAEAELAPTLIRERLTSGQPQITRAQVAAYYKQNIERYETPERRDIDIVERLPSKAAAQRAMSRLTAGPSMAKVAIHESFSKTNPAEVPPNKTAILHAIFMAKPNVLVGPLPLNEQWCFFEVTRVVPPVVQPLASLRDQIARQLAAERQRRALARAVAAWRAKWIARTDCRPGYVVQKCRQYRGAKAPEDATAFD
jgi:foldase protein PrsA